MALRMILLLLVGGLASAQRVAVPACEPEPGRKAERIHGAVNRAARFSQATPSGWIVRLTPVSEGWFLAVTTEGRETEDLSRLTPPWHFVPNPREIEGWHFRNADNTGPNDGGVSSARAVR